jgi:streptomycin 6-kinase
MRSLPEPIRLPPTLLHNLYTAFDAAETDAWAARLPALIAQAERRWGITVGAAFPGLSYNYVAEATCANGPAVLKVGIPNPELTSEIEAMRLYAGRGAARLLNADAGQGLLLLERIQPGALLAELAETDDEQATQIAANVMQQLWQPLPEQNPFHPMHRWVVALTGLRAQFHGATGPLPERLVDWAAGLCAELLGSMPPPVLLHGDCHHFNILDAGGGRWLVIDPKGVAGDPAYEPAPLLINPDLRRLDEAALRRLTRRRIDQVSEQLGLDRQRVWAWGGVHAVRSACWDVEDTRQGWRETLRVAEALHKSSDLSH